MFFPEADLILQDHDAAPVALFEVHQLCTLAKRTVLPYRCANDNIGVLKITEPYSRANAGLVIFPRTPNTENFRALHDQARQRVHETQNCNNPEDLKVLSLKYDLQRKRRLEELCQRKQPAHMQTFDDYYAPYHQHNREEAEQAGLLTDYLRRQTGLDWNLETQYSLLNNTPLYRSKASNRDDLIFAWCALGETIHLCCFPEPHLRSKAASTSLLDPEMQNRNPSLGKWAGPCFEQTCLQALFALQSSDATAIHMPGSHLFMEPHVPGRLDLYLPAPIFHGYGPQAKLLICALRKILTLFTLDEILSPRCLIQNGKLTKLLPMTMTPDGFQPHPGCRFKVKQHPVIDWSAAAKPSTATWTKTRDVPNACRLLISSFWKIKAEWPPLTRYAGIPEEHMHLLHQENPPKSATLRLSEKADVKMECHDEQPGSDGVVNAALRSQPSLDVKMEPPPGLEQGEAHHDQVSAAANEVVIVCPGLRTESIEGLVPTILLTNPSGNTTYGPTALWEEKWERKMYQMAAFPAPTLHGLKLLLEQRALVAAWKHVCCSPVRTGSIRPLPSFLHLPADSFMTALMIVLAHFSPDPMLAITRLIDRWQPPLQTQSATRCIIAGFSAGSQSGFACYRLLTDLGDQIGVEFGSGILGAICMHPIYFFDFHKHGFRAPLDSQADYEASTAPGTRRPALVHNRSDKMCLWNPSKHELEGVNQLGYRVVLIQPPKGSEGYGANGHRYSKLLLPIYNSRLSGELNVGNAGELLDLSGPSERLFSILVFILSLLGVKSLAQFVSTVLDQNDRWATTPTELPQHVFWNLLQSHISRTQGKLCHTADADTLKLIEVDFHNLFMHIPLMRQRWILFYALPSAFVRQAKGFFDSKPTQGTRSETPLLSQHCTTPKRTATSTLEAVVGKFAISITLAFAPPEPGDMSGWAVFLPPGVKPASVDVQEYLQRIFGQTVKGKGKSKGKSRSSDRAALGFQIGDIVQFSLQMDEFPDFPPLQLVGIVRRRNVYKSNLAQSQGVVPFHRVTSLNLLVTFVPRHSIQLVGTG